MPKLTDPTLLASDAFIDGRWRESSTGTRFSVTDPASGEAVAAVADCSADDAKTAVAAAAAAAPGWGELTAHDRADHLMRWHDLMVEHADDLAAIMTAEQGKPLAEARGEIMYGAGFVSWFAEEGKRAYGQVIPSPWDGARIVVLKQPVGVAAAVTPWNFPNAMITRKAAPALAAGCPFIVKPAAETPLSALALGVLAERAGIPAGVFNVVPTSSAAAVGGVLTGDERIAKFSFTGSTEIGKILLGQTATTVKNVSMELGGNAPFLVFDDADVDAAVVGAVAAKYRNNGQTCVCANRFLVQRGIQPAFTAKLAEASAALSVGPGSKPGVDVGPLINPAALAKVEELVGSAVGAGATLHTGGSLSAAGGLFYQPTVLSGVLPTMEIASAEIFGPVSSIITFDTEEEAIHLANDTRFGLAAYFYTNDTKRAWRVAEGLEYGMVGANTGRISTPVAPFGGWKESGIGREGAQQGLEEYLETKFVAFDIS
ncbi:MAG: NAD-dependent succinate-semialdehyde dehydrogenase [Acidimicrobiia bacterium]|nr:NAD-dependent succinate-semialdehyde dehydrogenase [Acidimicrobiia bacterium]